MSDLELIYFPISGRAMPIRLVFAIGGISFKDTRIAPHEYGAQIGTGAFPLDTLPVLKKGGKVIAAQSQAILRYAARLAGLELKGVMDTLRGEDMAGTMGEVAELFVKWFTAGDEKKEEFATELIESGFPFFAKRAERILEEGGQTGPYVTESLTFVDIFVYCVCSNFMDIVAKSIGKENPLKGYPKLSALVNAVATIPAVQQYQ